MFRLLGKIEIYGTKDSVNKCALIAQIPDGMVKQVGLKRKIPDVDSWVYASPWYRFHPDPMMDDEVHDFLTSHLQVGNALAVRDVGIEYAFFSLCPVGSSDERSFSGIFSCETLKLLVDMGLELQIGPESIMPDVPYWKR